MTITEFEKEKVYSPFLGTTLTSINGLDQLGLNLTSERIFDFLLPGLNNVTNRIRYYSFYCWFFDWYSKEIQIPSSREQFKYLRRAEFLLSLIAASKDLQGIPGILKANDLFGSGRDSWHLDEGTKEQEKNNEGAYWKNPRGVLGQYYISSLKQIGIIKEQGEINGVFIRTDYKNEEKISGLQLAEAFSNNIGNKAIEIFTTVLKEKIVNKESLNLLGEVFIMNEIPLNSEENVLLFQLLIKADRPGEAVKTYYRKNSLKLQLQFLKEPANELVNQFHLPWQAYNENISGNAPKEATFALWGLFMVEQFWSIACTSLLESFLEKLENKSGGSWVVLEKFLENLASDIHQDFLQNELNGTSTTFEKLHEVPENEWELYSFLKDNISTDKKCKIAFQLIHKICGNNKKIKKELLDLSKKNNLNTKSSFLNSLEKIEELSQLDLYEFIQIFLKKFIIYRHHFVSLRKMTASQSSAKFTIEDGLIRYLESFNFDLSSPRLHTVNSFLEDLNIKKRGDFELSEYGLQILKKMKNDN